jgi:RNA polymerase sigma-70 factor (ECF subfamily)
LVRAKRQLREERIEIETPGEEELVGRLDGVLRVLYLLFNEGYGATRGQDLVRVDLCEEAIRLGELLLQHERLQLPVVHALLALMMLQAARLPARTQQDGTLALLSEQDRSLWNQRLISLGIRHHGWSGAGNRLTAYHLQAEIAAIHATAESESATDWQRISTLYEELYELEPTPIVALNAAIAQARWRGPQAGLDHLERTTTLAALGRYHLLPAVKAELWKELGDLNSAAESYRAALACPCTEPERRSLQKQLESVSR